MNRFLMFLAALLLTSSVAYSQVPHQINMQSLIFDEDGNITTSDFVDLTVRILDEQNTVVFTETHRDVPVVAGAVQIAIGSQNILDLDALDPATGPKVMDVLVDGTSPFELLPLGAVPYSMWAERAVSVVEDSIESQHIKNGTIKVEDLEPGLAFSNIQGQASDNQIPNSVATDAELNAHITSPTAHPASAIVLSGQFATFVGNNIQDAIRGLDSRLRDEIVFRQNGVNALNNTVAGIQNHLSNNMMDKRGATMSGPISFDDAGCIASTGQVCTVDGVDVSSLNNKVTSLENATVPDNSIGLSKLKSSVIEGNITCRNSLWPKGIVLEEHCELPPTFNYSIKSLSSPAAFLPIVWMDMTGDNANLRLINSTDSNGLTLPPNTALFGPIKYDIEIFQTSRDFNSGPDEICFKTVLTIENGCSANINAAKLFYKVYKISE